MDSGGNFSLILTKTRTKVMYRKSCHLKKITCRRSIAWKLDHLLIYLTCILLGIVLTGCALSSSVEFQGELKQTVEPILSASPTQEMELTPTQMPSPSPTLTPDGWKKIPVLPQVSQTAREIYQRSIMAGHNPHHFSKVGDCQNVPSMFMAAFDEPAQFSLGDDYSYLQSTIDWFAGSFSRESQAVRRGFNAASIVSPFWADPEYCQSGENPLECELRIHKPVIVIISLETWWEKGAESYEKYLREIIETTIEHNVVPIISTKADNLEGDHSINATMAMLAQEYDIPFWNFWLAVQPLPSHGLKEDAFHLTYAANYFDDPERMKAAWPWRNLTALQSLHVVWTDLSSPRSQP